MSDKILDIIYSTFKETLEANDFNLPDNIGLDTNLIGHNGILDSLAFVSFIIAVEQKVNQQFNRSISLNSEKAFSLKYNPFRSVGTLLSYIMENWNE